jgi:ATP-dependent DNA ligase
LEFRLAYPVVATHLDDVFKPNPVEFELPYEEGLLLDIRPEWIAEQKLEGVRAVLEFGRLQTRHARMAAPGAVPHGWKSHAFDGVLVDKTFYLFDVLMLDFEDMRKRPLHERRTLLRSLKLPDWCRLVPNGKNIGEFMEAVVRDGGQGVVLKSLLQPYGKAEWIKVERTSTEDVVIMVIHEKDRCVTVGQFQGESLVDCGTVFMGSLLEEAYPGQVIEVAVGRRTSSVPFKNARFLRFRPDMVAANCKMDS